MGTRHDARTTGRAALTAAGGRERALRHALEIRHPSWLAPQALELLQVFDIALVAAETAGRHPFSLARTASFAYVRLHGATRLYASRYTDEELEMWARQASAWAAAGHDVFIYFDNDAEGHAPHDAVRLAARVRSSGTEQTLPCSSSPDPQYRRGRFRPSLARSSAA